MKQLIENGNIFSPEKPYECLECFESGYFRYTGEYTLLRKYACTNRFYEDRSSYLYKEPVSKNKNPEVLIGEDVSIPEDKNYYVRVCGTSRKVLPPAMYRIWDDDSPVVLINKDIHDLMNILSWQNKPQINPVQVITTSNTIASKPGDFYMLRQPRWWYSDFTASSSYVDWRAAFFFYEVSAVSPYGEVVYEKRVLDLFHADIIAYDGQEYETEKPTKPRLSFSFDLLFSLKAVKKLVTIDPDFVFAPVHVTELPIEDFILRRKNMDKECLSLFCREGSAAAELRRRECNARLRAYLKKWAKFYDQNRFNRDYIVLCRL